MLFAVDGLVIRASRIDEVIIDGKRKRLSLLVLRGTGHDSRRFVGVVGFGIDLASETFVGVGVEVRW